MGLLKYIDFADTPLFTCYLLLLTFIISPSVTCGDSPLIRGGRV